MKTYDHECDARDDGLSLCNVCGGAEGTLPALCPGRRMTTEEQEAVGNGRLDFDRIGHRAAAWWRREPLRLRVVHDGPSCAMLVDDAGRLFAVKQLVGGQWANAGEEVSEQIAAATGGA